MNVWNWFRHELPRHMFNCFPTKDRSATVVNDDNVVVDDERRHKLPILCYILAAASDFIIVRTEHGCLIDYIIIRSFQSFRVNRWMVSTRIEILCGVTQPKQWNKFSSIWHPSMEWRCGIIENQLYYVRCVYRLWSSNGRYTLEKPLKFNLNDYYYYYCVACTLHVLVCVFENRYRQSWHRHCVYFTRSNERTHTRTYGIQ